MKHSKEPWKRGGLYGTLKTEVTDESDHAVATVWTRRFQHREPGQARSGETEPWPEGEANLELILAAPDLLADVEVLRAALEELLASRERQHRIGLWIVRFPHIKTSSIEPKSAARERFEIWYTRATCRVIEAEEQARAALGAAGDERRER